MYNSLENLLCNFIEIALRHECSPVNLTHIFRTPFPKNTFEGLLLDFKKITEHEMMLSSGKPFHEKMRKQLVKYGKNKKKHVYDFSTLSIENMKIKKKAKSLLLM